MTSLRHSKPKQKRLVKYTSTLEVWFKEQNILRCSSRLRMQRFEQEFPTIVLLLVNSLLGVWVEQEVVREVRLKSTTETTIKNSYYNHKAIRKYNSYHCVLGRTSEKRRQVLVCFNVCLNARFKRFTHFYQTRSLRISASEILQSE